MYEILALRLKDKKDDKILPESCEKASQFITELLPTPKIHDDIKAFLKSYNFPSPIITHYEASFAEIELEKPPLITLKPERTIPW
ncbi:hypothetical protein HanIR_Chr13g0656031 [Helianthus annuus]|nr:hypothetical protein HanIR_Chr13g0656031 [Helianthus annuus]